MFVLSLVDVGIEIVDIGTSYWQSCYYVWCALLISDTYTVAWTYEQITSFAFSFFFVVDIISFSEL